MEYFRNLRHYFRALDLFQEPALANPDDNLYQGRTNVIATRVYLILLVVIIFILTLNTSLTNQSIEIVIEYPTRVQFESLPSDAQCGCSKVSLSYDQFLSQRPSFHPICSSDFVSDAWISSVYFGNQSTSFRSNDFRRMGFTYFQTLASLCSLSIAIVNQNLSLLMSDSFISPKVLTSKALTIQTLAYAEQFQLNAPKSLETNIDLLNALIAGILPLNGLHTSILPIIDLASPTRLYLSTVHNRFLTRNGTWCICLTSIGCEGEISGIYSNNISMNEPLIVIPGLRSGCMPVEGCLHSTLECFFNQTCINMLTSYLNISMAFSAISRSESSSNDTNHFPVASTVASIVSQLMVEDWGFRVSYEKYYELCAPKLCTYLMMTRNNALFVLGKIIGLLGGLCTVLGFCVPFIVRFIRQRIRRRSNLPRLEVVPPPTSTNTNRLLQVLNTLKNAVAKLNLFEEDNIVAEERSIRTQRIGTYVYIICLLLSMIVLVFYTSLSEDLYKETVINPTEVDFSHLQNLYPVSLRCRCKTISINYEIFLTIKPFYHQICTSDFVSSSWIQYLGENYQPSIYVLPDFRASAASIFQVLATLCQNANQTIQTSLELFFQQHMVTEEVVSKDLFEAYAIDLVRNWKARTIQDYLRTFLFFRAILQGNQLLSDENNFPIGIGENSYVFVGIAAFTDGTLISGFCRCDLSAQCHWPMAIVSDENSIYWIDGLLRGCSPIDSLFQSTLIMFYNQTELNKFLSLLPINSQGYQFKPLNITSNTVQNELIESIANRVFVDDWIINVSFNNYYKTCSPETCIYEIKGRRHLLIIITIMIGVLGGLSTGLKILFFVGLILFAKIRNNRSWHAVKIWLSSLIDERYLARRLHTILIVLTLAALYLSSAFVRHTQTTEVAVNPSLETYRYLMVKYSGDSLNCLCSKIAVPYGSFMNLSVIRYHQVCSSEIITLKWLDMQFTKSTNSPNGLRDLISAYIQWLGFFCQLTPKTIDNAIAEFLAQYYIQTSINLSEADFHREIQFIIRQFQLSIPLRFLQLLDLAREMTSINTLMSRLQNSWYFSSINPTGNLSLFANTIFPTATRFYQSCNCGLSKRCMQSATMMYNRSLPGLMIGCYALEALLKSTLECFYLKECFKIPFIDQSLVRPNESVLLQPSADMRFNSNSTVETIVNELLIEQWFNIVSYEQYYEQCAPTTCSYSYLVYPSTIDIITSILGLYGGLVIIMKVLVVPVLIHFWRNVRRRRQRIESSSLEIHN